MRMAKRLPEPKTEPIGIVIADGGQVMSPTRFSAFVWGPVPDELLDAPSVDHLLDASPALALAAV